MALSSLSAVQSLMLIVVAIINNVEPNKQASLGTSIMFVFKCHLVINNNPYCHFGLQGC